MLILLIALPLLTGLAAALPFPSRRGRLTFLLTMQIIETALVVWTLVSGRSYATNIWHLTESLTIAMKLDGVAAVFAALTLMGSDGWEGKCRAAGCRVPRTWADAAGLLLGCDGIGAARLMGHAANMLGDADVDAAIERLHGARTT